MASKDFTSLDELFRYIDKMAMDSLKNETAETAKQQMSQVIEDVTYEQYTPLEYIRTHELSNIANMEVTVIDDNTIQIVNTRHDGDTDVARVVVTGEGYSWKDSPIAKAQLARNFYEDTYNFLKHNGKHIDAFKRGMKRRGIDVV